MFVILGIIIAIIIIIVDSTSGSTSSTETATGSTGTLTPSSLNTTDKTLGEIFGNPPISHGTHSAINNTTVTP